MILVLDPMLATANSAVAAVERLKGVTLAQWIEESGWARSDLASLHFNFAGMMKDAGAGAKKVIVDGVTGLPKDIGPAMAEEFRKEGAKIVDNRGWLSWRELREKEKEEEENG